MQYFIIADEDTVLGFRYAGVDGQVVHTPEEARAALVEQVAAKRAGVVIVTDEIARAIGDEFDRMRFESRMPLVVQVPGPQGPAPDRADLMDLIREAMGINI